MNQNLNEKISIIVPAYNVEKYIEKCIESLINQTYKNIEIIIVNDGSKDNTLNIINKYAQKDNRIKLINQENQGVSESRNNALKLVTGEYIMFVDSDDWLDLNTCEEILKNALEEKADIVMFGYIREYDNKSLTKSIFEDEKLIFEGDEVQSRLQRRIFGPIDEELRYPEKLNAITPVWGKFYKTTILKDVEFISLKNIGVCEDGYFNIFAFEKAKKVVFVKKFFYHYRKVLSGSAITQKKDGEIYDKSKRFYSKLIELIRQSGTDATYKKEVNGRLDNTYKEHINKELDNTYKEAAYNRLALTLIENGLTILKTYSDKKIIYIKIKEILKDEQYRNAIKQIKLKYFPFHWKFFFISAKIRFSLGVYLLLKIILKLINKI